MLVPTSADLRQALARYAEAAIDDTRHPTPGTARAREDRAYTLCVMTGTTDVASAICAADTLLEGRATGLVQSRPTGSRPASTSAGTPDQTLTASLSPAASAGQKIRDDVIEAA